MAGLETLEDRLDAFDISVAMFPGNGVQLGLQSTYVTLLNICGAVTGAGVEIEIVHVKLILLLGKFVLSSLELDKFFAIDDMDKI